MREGEHILSPEQTLEEWMNQYSNVLGRIAYSYVRDRGSIEDLLQNTFLKAYRSMNQLSDQQNPFPWLAKILSNECKDFKKRRWREIVSPVLPEMSTRSTEDTWLQNDESEQIYEIVLSLPEKYRIPLVLFYFEELSNQEIADILQTTSGAIRTRMTRGRQLLIKRLEDRNYEHRGSTSHCKMPT